MYAAAVFQLILAIGLGTIFSWLLTKTGLTFPIYIGAMLAAALIRNIAEYTNFTTIHMGEINDLGGISLSLFLGMAMITLKLWELASLALPLVILLAAQTLLIGVFTYFVIFRIMGHDYDAAVLAAGTCGFGMGATPNAMANMQALCDRFVPSVKAYLLIPLVGSLFLQTPRLTMTTLQFLKYTLRGGSNLFPIHVSPFFCIQYIIWNYFFAKGGYYVQHIRLL